MRWTDAPFLDVDNLHCCDGSVYPTSAGWNPSLTLGAVALGTAHCIVGA